MSGALRLSLHTSPPIMRPAGAAAPDAFDPQESTAKLKDYTMNLHPIHIALLVAGTTTSFASQAMPAPIEDVATFLGTTLEALQAINPMTGGQIDDRGMPGIMTQGVAMARTLSVKAGDTLSFDWFFGTDEGPLGAGNGVIDFALFSVNGALTRLATVDDSLEPAASSAFIEQIAPLSNGDYFRSQTVTFDSAGNYTVGFAVVDVVDTAVRTTLVLDNVRLNGELFDNSGFEDFGSENAPVYPFWQALGSPRPWNALPGVTEGTYGVALISADGGSTPAPVPLPAGAWLFGSALGALGWRARRRA